MAFTLCLSGEAIKKAGANANSDITGWATAEFTTALEAFSTESEGSMELETGMTLLDSFSGLATGIQGAINDICSSKIAMKIISFDTTGYLSREADTLLNVQDDIINKGMSRLRDFKKLTLNSPT